MFNIILNFILNLIKTWTIPKNSLYNSNYYNLDIFDKDAKKISTVQVEKKIENIKEKEMPIFCNPVLIYKITSKFGWRLLPNGRRNFHNGTDFSGKNNKAFAIEDSIVKKVLSPASVDPYMYEYKNDKWVVINENAHTPYVVLFGIHTGNKYIYAHGKELVTVGKKLKAGDTVCTVDSFGYSMGKHLHLGIRDKSKNYEFIDPDSYLKKKVRGKKV